MVKAKFDLKMPPDNLHNYILLLLTSFLHSIIVHILFLHSLPVYILSFFRSICVHFLSSKFFHSSHPLFLLHCFIHSLISFLSNRLGLYNTLTAHLQRGKTPPISVMTLNNLMVRFQLCWSLGKCRESLHCHRSRVNSGPES